MDEGTLARMVGAAMAGRRKQRGYTQAQLTERLSLSQESLSRMEKGLISPKFSRLQDIADASLAAAKASLQPSRALNPPL